MFIELGTTREYALDIVVFPLTLFVAVMDQFRSARVRWKLLMERRGHRLFRTCPTCGGSLSAEWPYLDPATLKEHKHIIRNWKSSEAAGCDFCSVVTLVTRYAVTQLKLEPHSANPRQLHVGYDDREIKVSWGKKFDRFVFTLDRFSNFEEGITGSFAVYPKSATVFQ